MSSSHSHLKSFLSSLTLTLAFALLSMTAGAQTTTNATASTAAKAEAVKSEEVAAEPLQSQPATQAVAIKAVSDETDAANAKTDAAQVEAGPIKVAPVKAATVETAAVPSTAVLPSPSPSTETATKPAPPAPVQPPTCKRTITADVVALEQPYMLNRLGASMPNALIFALRSDVLGTTAATAQLKPWKRARPLVLRANQGDCLVVTLTNLYQPPATNAASSTPPVSLHVQGMQLVNGIADDGSFVGTNNSSLAGTGQSKTYTLFAQQEGTYLLYSEGDSNTTGQQLRQGLFGAVNVQPDSAEWYRSQVTQDDLRLATKSVTPAGQPIVDYNALYPATYAQDPSRACTPILKMADSAYKVVTNPAGIKTCQKQPGNMMIYHTDLTAIITGPNAGRFPGTTGIGKPEPPCNKAGQAGVNVNPLFCQSPALPDRKQPYREVTVIYHEVFQAANQAFPIFQASNPDGSPNPAFQTVLAGQDAFAINYGTGGIGAEIYANRIGVGPMANCVDCKFEEFFLTSWAVGDPAMVVDIPANSAPPPPPPPCQPPNALTPGSPCLAPTTKDPVAGPKATKAFYPDDPSNVYHSYLNDHIKFRILHGGTGVTHVHHQHAHQWVQSPNSSEGSYLDSQFISPGASYTLEMVYNGSGNRNKTPGDSIFHCHFYPHFAAGMWAMWRVHDVFEAGTLLDANGIPDQVKGTRALPDGEIVAGTPIPAVVPLPTMPMPLMPSPVFVGKVTGLPGGQVIYGTPAAQDPTGLHVKANPGYPFFIPGVAGMRPPHPPLDFAPDTANLGQFLDGGLPRHVNTGGTTPNQLAFQTNINDWSKDFATLDSTQLPEDGTNVEKVAMGYFGQRCRPTFLPDGSAANPFGPQNYPECGPTASKANFILNGLPRKTAQNPSGAQRGAPFADPAVLDKGEPVGKPRTYKAAAIQMDVKFNDRGWHYQQQRFLTLWQDVSPSFSGARRPEPFFFRANSQDDFIEYWHTNLVPNYYLLDAFQVRTPTDILGQHIHLVKFDVTSSDGAANGFNYEDGTFSPDEVQEIHEALTNGGNWKHCAGCSTDLRTPTPPPAEICSVVPTPSQCTKEWLGAQTTIQRWYADPFFDNDGQDNTIRTVFTHDHFGPSTHQQAGLYAGLLVEPKGSTWRSNEGDVLLGTRTDGGPTTWQARILTPNAADSYREFALEFQDFTLAYAASPGGPVNPPRVNGVITPTLISTGGQPPPGTQTVNYYHAPVPFRAQGDCDLSLAFSSSCVPASGATMNGDPLTPLLRAYENDKVQVRILVGAHTFSHFFTMGGPRWLFEPSWSNSGFRSSQGMGISEHFELLFNVPASSVGKFRTKCPDGTYPDGGDCVDYIYTPSDDNFGITNGVWGLMRAYDATKPINNLKTLPSNGIKAGATLAYQTCPQGQPANKIRTYNVTAISAQKALPNGQIVFNSRGTTADPTDIIRSKGLMYAFTEDLDANGKLKGPVEPLILRANAGDCIIVNLTNEIDPADPNVVPLHQADPWPQPFFEFGTVTASKYVSIHPQLLSYDGGTDGGINVGYNQKNQTVGYKQPKMTYVWYAGSIGRTPTGTLTYTPVEFGSLNLLPADPLMQHQWALFGGMVIEPAGSTWRCDADAKGTTQSPCEPGSPGYDPSKVKTRASATVTPPNATAFREFVAMVTEDLILRSNNRSSINYRTEPTFYRYGNTNPGTGPQLPTFSAPDPPGGDNSCALSNALVGNTDPQTPIFTAIAGTPVRFRLMHPQGTGTAQVFTINGHVWQREPYIANSTSMGNNQLSQWLGSHDSHGGTDHQDLLINSAGGLNGVPGDYLYTTFVPNQNMFGSWGIFRVLNKSGQQVAGNPVCPPPPANPKPAAPLKDDLNRFLRPPFSQEKKP